MSNPLSAMLGDSPIVADEVVSETPVAEATPPEAPETPAEAPEKPAERPRGPGGKFVKADAETPPTAAPEPTPEPPAKDPLPGIAAMLDEREKRQAAVARAEAAERRLKELEAAQTPREPPTESEALQQALYLQNLRSSRRFAEREYGKDTIAEVHTWAAAKCDEDPHFNAMMRSSEDPYESAYQAFNRDKIAAEVSPGDFAEFRAWKAAQASLATQPQTFTPPQSSAPPTPPRSLAHAPGNGALGKEPPVEVAPGAAFGSAFT